MSGDLCFFQAEDGIRYLVRSRGLGDVYKRQGHTGQAFAKKLRGFDVEILVYDKYNLAKDDFVKSVSLEELQLYSDIISFHVPYNLSLIHI